MHSLHHRGKQSPWSMIGIQISSNTRFEGYPSGIQGPETQYFSDVNIAIAAQKITERKSHKYV